MIETQRDEHSPPRSEEEPKGKSTAGTRNLVSYIPVASAALGIAVIIGSVVFIFGPNDLRRLLFVAFGLGILVAGIWFAAHPFIRSSRRFMHLRGEVEAFLDLVKVLSQQAQGAEAAENFESTRAKMHEAVERMVAESGKVAESSKKS